MLKKYQKGFCDICNQSTQFQINGNYLRNDYLCKRCNSLPRQRALIHVIKQLYPDYLNAAIIHESSPGGPSSDMLYYKAKNYSFSHYYPSVPSGEIGPDGAVSQDLENLAMDNNSMDIFITQDVFEHVFDIEKAFSEIARVLKPGGMHIFTAPRYLSLTHSFCRAEKNTDGTVHYLAEPIYHGNPVDKNGSLVVWDYGADFASLIFKVSGLFTEVYDITDRHFGIDGELKEVFVSRKPQ